jgi:protein AaeX
MIRELDVFGVFLPPLVLMVALALPAWMVLRYALAASGIGARIWPPALFHLASFVLVLSLVILASFG